MKAIVAYKKENCLVFIETAALCLVKASVISSPFIIFLSLTVFKIGVWPKLEAVICGLYGVSLFTTLNIFILCVIKPEKYLRSCFHPIVVFPVLLGFFSLFNTYFSEVPMLNLFGDPRFGQGAVRYFNIASLCAGVLILDAFSVIRKQLSLSCLTVTLVVVCLHVITQQFPQWKYNTYNFIEYLAFFGAYGLVILLTGLTKITVSGKIFLILINISIILYSKNRTGILLCLTLGFVVLFSSFFFKKGMIENNLQKFKGGGVLLSILLPIVIILSIMIFNSVDKYDYLKNNLYSVHSRALLWEVGLKTAFNNPEVLTHGLGWGHYSNQLIRFAAETGGSLYDKIEWDALIRGDWHSHNDFIETLLSAGIPGLLLWWCMIAGLPLFCKKEFIVLAILLSVYLSCLLSLWFQFPAGIPLMAICFAFISKPASEFKVINKLNISYLKYGVCFLILCITLVQCYAFLYTLNLGVQINKIKLKFFASDNTHKEISTLPVSELVKTGGPGGMHFATLYRNLVSKEFESGKAFDANSPVYIFKSAFDTLYNSSDQKCLAFYLSGLFAYNKIALKLNAWQTDNAAPYLMFWEDRLMTFINKADLRTDIAVPFLLWRLSKKDDATVYTISEYMLSMNPHDPVGLWFYGLSGIELGQTSAIKSMEYLKQSLENGIESIMPIDNELKLKIKMF